MRSTVESQVIVGSTGEVEAVRVGELGLVTVGRTSVNVSGNVNSSTRSTVPSGLVALALGEGRGVVPQPAEVRVDYTGLQPRHRSALRRCQITRSCDAHFCRSGGWDQVCGQVRGGKRIMVARTFERLDGRVSELDDVLVAVVRGPVEHDGRGVVAT